MTITTRRVTGPIVLPDGSVPANGRVIIALSGWDREDGQGVMAGPIMISLDDDGVFDADLWCTDTGENGRVYTGLIRWFTGSEWRSQNIQFDVPSGTGDLSFAPIWVVGDLPPSTQADALAQCLAAAASAALDRVATEEDREAVEKIAERIDLGALDQAVAATADDRVQTALDRAASQTASVASEAARDQAQTAAANAQSSALTCATWAVLSTLTGSTDGQGAEVLDTDTGAHHAASATGYNGASVSNAGRYSWSATWSRWVRIGATGLTSKATTAALTSTVAALTTLTARVSDAEDVGASTFIWARAEKYIAADQSGADAIPATVLDFANWRAASPGVSADTITIASRQGLVSRSATALGELLSASGDASMVTGGALRLCTAEADTLRRDWDGDLGAGLLVEDAVENLLTNPGAVGAIAGTPGTSPTGWSISPLSGISREIIGRGDLDGVPYLDIRFFGTATGTSYGSSIYLNTSTIAGVQGDTFTFSASVSVSGDLSGVAASDHPKPFLELREVDAAQSLLAYSRTDDIIDGDLARYSVTRTLTNASAVGVRACIRFWLNVGASVDFTMRIMAPQVEIGAVAHSPVPPPAAVGASTKSADAVASGAETLALLGRDEWTIAIRAKSLSTAPGVDRTLLGLSAAGGVGALIDGSGAPVWTNGADDIMATPGVSMADGFCAVLSWDGAARRLSVNGGAVTSDSNSPGVINLLGLGSGGGSDVPFDGRIYEVVIWATALSSASMMEQSAILPENTETSGTNLETFVPTEVQALREEPSRFNRRRISLWSGGVYQVPKGWISLDMGPFLDLAHWDPEREIWQISKKPISGNVPTFWSDGESWRVVNLVNCTVYAALTANGTGYSKATPPTITSTLSPVHGRTKPQFRAIVGGAVHVTVEDGGVYDYPPYIVWDVSQQTPPFRVPQVLLVPDSVTGAVSVLYQGNDNPSKGTEINTGYSGSGLDVSTLGWTIVRDPRDTQTDDAVISIVEGGADEVTSVACTEFGAAHGNVDARSAFSINHNGGSGFAFKALSNYYVIEKTIVDAGEYQNSSGNPYSSSSDGGYGTVLPTTNSVDEMSRALWQLSPVVIEGGAVALVNQNALGPGLQERPRLIVIPPPGATVIRDAKITAVLGTGADYFTMEVRS